MDHAVPGASEDYSESQTADMLRAENGVFRLKRSTTGNALYVHRSIKDLQQGHVIGWHQGRVEWGPRALGQRSILADPGNPKMKDIVNIKIKFREPYRPFAPSVLAEETNTYFELPDWDHQLAARFMLLVTPVRREQSASSVPNFRRLPTPTAVRIRFQTVFKETQPDLLRPDRTLEAGERRSRGDEHLV